MNRNKVIIIISLILITFFLIKIVLNMLINKKNININASKERLYNDVKFLSSINPPRNYENIDSLNKIADYIYKEFNKLDTTSVEIQRYFIENDEYKNVIASFGPQDSERIIIGAHYDVFDDYPGADDNASAVAGLLEIARLISELKPDLKKRIDLVAYSLEEPPFFDSEFMGSSVHAKSLYDSKVKITVAISLEMLGYFTDKPDSQKYPLPVLNFFYPDKGNFISIVGMLGSGKIIKNIKSYMKEVSNIDIQSLTSPIIIPGISLSDHRSYWKYNYKAVMITDTALYRNPNYHEKTDTIDTLDFYRMKEVVKGVYWAVINL